jgi:hypothetical protein
MKRILTVILVVSILVAFVSIPSITVTAEVWQEEVAISFDRFIYIGNYYIYHDFDWSSGVHDDFEKCIVIYLDDNNNEMEIYFNPNIEKVIYNRSQVDTWDVINEISPEQPFNRGRNGTITLSNPNSTGEYQTIEVMTPYIFAVDRVEENGMIYVVYYGGGLYTHYSTFKTMDEQPLQIQNIKKGDVWEVFYTPYQLSTDFSDRCVNQLTETVTGEVTASDYSPKSWYVEPSTSWGTPENSFLINDSWYDLSYRPYMPRNVSLGSKGTFYIDGYGKIAAFFPAIDEICFSEWTSEKIIVTDALVKDGEPRVLIVALYGTDDKLKGIQTSSKTSVITHDGYKDLDSIYTRVVDGDYVKAFIWEDLASMKPVSPMKRFDYKE